MNLIIIPCVICTIVLIIIFSTVIVCIFSKNDLKIKGRGIVFDEDSTSFILEKSVLPLIDVKYLNILNNSNCFYLYSSLKNKKLFDLKKCTKGLNELNEIYNLFNEFETDYCNKDDIEKLQELYYDIIIYNKPNIKKELKDVLEIVSKKELDKKLDKELVNKYLERHKNKYKNEIKENVENNVFDNNTKRMISTNIINECEKINTTEIPKELIKKYYEIIGITKDSYKKLIKTLCNKIDFIEYGSLIQTKVKNENLYNTDFLKILYDSKKKRNWYKNMKFTFFAQYQSESSSDQADIIPATISDAFLQLLIYLYIKNKTINKQELFCLLKSTRLNIWFINILANVKEDKSFNCSLGNSFEIF